MPFKQLLQKELDGKLSKERLEILPSGYQQLENIIIIKLKPELQKEKKEIAKAIASIFPYAKTIMQIKEIQGKFHGDGCCNQKPRGDRRSNFPTSAGG